MKNTFHENFPLTLEHPDPSTWRQRLQGDKLQCFVPAREASGNKQVGAFWLFALADVLVGANSSTQNCTSTSTTLTSRGKFLRGSVHDPPYLCLRDCPQSHSFLAGNLLYQLMWHWFLPASLVLPKALLSKPTSKSNCFSRKAAFWRLPCNTLTKSGCQARAQKGNMGQSVERSPRTS